MRAPARLAEVLDSAPAGMLSALSTPRGLDVPVLASVLLDVTDSEPADVEGGILHLVGVLPDDPRAPDLIAQGGALGYAAGHPRGHQRPGPASSSGSQQPAHRALRTGSYAHCAAICSHSEGHSVPPPHACPTLTVLLLLLPLSVHRPVLSPLNTGP